MLEHTYDRSPVVEPVARAVAIAGLAGIALVHLLDAHDTFAEVPYKGFLFVGLILASVVVAGLLLYKPDTRAWVAATALALATLVAFVWSRTIGLPNGADDIGNWWEPLGLASLFVEGAVVALGVSVLARRHAAAVEIPRARWRDEAAAEEDRDAPLRRERTTA
jgi:hypothetical protein